MTHEELEAIARLLVKPDVDYDDYDLPVEVLTLAEGYLALSLKLEEALCERNDLRVSYINMISGKCARGHVERQQKCPACHDIRDSRGEVVKTCPHCGAHLIAQGPSGRWVCGRCEVGFDEPAYWQRVMKGPEA